MCHQQNYYKRIATGTSLNRQEIRKEKIFPALTSSSTLQDAQTTAEVKGRQNKLRDEKTIKDSNLEKKICSKDLNEFKLI